MAKRRAYKGARKTSKYKQGFFKPKNPDKYKGDPNKIVYRSSWEMKFMFRLDADPFVTKWSSEEVIIPYKSPKDGRMRRYFMDFWVKRESGKEYLFEVKPKCQTLPPVRGKKRETTYLNEVITFQVNQAKWQAAEQYAQKRGMIFKKLTEEELNV